MYFILFYGMFHLLLPSEELRVHLACGFISCFFASLLACSLAEETTLAAVATKVTAAGLLGKCGCTLLVALVCFAFLGYYYLL